MAQPNTISVVLDDATLTEVKKAIGVLSEPVGLRGRILADGAGMTKGLKKEGRGWATG